MNSHSPIVYPLGLVAFAAVWGVVFFLSQEKSSVPFTKTDQAGDTAKSSQRSQDSSSSNSSRPKWTGAEVTPDLITSMWEEGAYDQILSAFDYWLLQDPEAAVSFLEGVKQPIVRMHFAGSLADYLLTLPPEEGLALVSSFRLIEQDFHISVCLPAFQKWSEDSPAQAQAWLAETSQTFLAFEVGRASVFGEHAEQISRFVSMEESQTQENLVTGALQSWLSSDPDAAIDYLNSVKASSSFDRASFRYLNTFIQEDPGAAKTWADSLIDVGLRTMALQTVETVVRNSCPDCQVLFHNTLENSELRLPVDQHAFHFND